MKKYLTMILSNLIIFIPLLCGYYFNDYHFFIKSFLYVLIVMTTLVEFTLIGVEKAFLEYYPKSKKQKW